MTASRGRLLSLDHFALLDLSPTNTLRIVYDLGVVAVAVAAAWLLLHGGDTRLLTGHSMLLLWTTVALLALTFVVFTAGGLHTSDHTEPIGKRSRRIAMLTALLFVVLGALVLIVGSPLQTLIGARAAQIVLWLLASFTLSFLLLAGARLGSHLLRQEEVGSVALAADRTDPNHVLVIGGGGYIGSALVADLLKRGRKVTVLDALHFGEDPLASVLGHQALTLIREDFRHIEAVTRAMNGVDSVIHLGGLVGDPACAVAPDLTIDVNVTATKLLGEIAKARGVRRFIFASSCSVYGANDDIVDETSSFNPQSLYARSKVASEVVLMPLSDASFAVTCLRFATVYGISGRTRFDLVANLLCAKAVRDREITVFGPDQWRPFVHVEDVARAVATVLEAPVEKVAGEAFNVGSDDQNHTLGDLAIMIRRQVPEAEIVSQQDCPDKRNYRVSFAKIRDRLGFTPAWTVDDGIRQVLRIVRSNQIGHYANPTYSNVLFLKQQDIKSFSPFRITGWENEFMNVSQLIEARIEPPVIAS